MSLVNSGTIEPKYQNTIKFTIPDASESYHKSKLINGDILDASRQALDMFTKRAFPKICSFIHEEQQRTVEAGLFELTLRFASIIEMHFSGSYKDYITEIKYIYNLHDPITYPTEKIEHICRIKFSKHICEPVFELYRSKGYTVTLRESVNTENKVTHWFTISWDK